MCRWRWLLAISGMTILGGLAGAPIGPKVPTLGTPAATAQQSGDAVALQELAERLLARPYVPYPGAPGQAQTVQLLPRQLPSDLPLPIPLAPGGRLLGSAVYRADGQVTSTEVVIDVPAPPAEVFAFYQQALAGQGWTPPPSSPREIGGFQTTQVGATSYFCDPAGRTALSLAISPAAAGWSTVRGTVTPASPGPCGGLTSPPPRPAMDRLPRLAAPEGVLLQAVPGGGFFGDQSAASSATVETERSPSELEAHFARQLQAAGWTRQTGGADGPLAWSTWEVPGEGAWQGLLFVVAMPGHNRRFLYVRADSATTPPGPSPLPPTG